MKKDNLKMILGFILMPLFACIYFLDRIILVGLFWIESKTLLTFFNNWSLIKDSSLRVLSIGVFYLIYNLIKWI